MAEYPSCTCGVNSWNSGGSQIGPSYAFMQFTCASCGRIGQYLGRDGWFCFLIPEKGQEPPLEYINTTMLVQTRAYKAVHEAVNKAKDKILFDDLLVQWGLDPAKGCHYNHIGDDRFEYQDDEGNRLDVDEALFREAEHRLYQDNPPRPSVVRAPDPINAPPGVTIFVSRNMEWQVAKPTEGKLPKDPLRLRHDRIYGEIFSEVQKRLSLTFKVTERANGYYEDVTKSEPWYEFDVAGAEFIVGPRKRVTHISFKTAKPVAYQNLERVANVDRATFDARPPWADEQDALIQGLDQDSPHWLQQVTAVCNKVQAEFQGDRTKSTQVLIHAWDKDKAIHYLVLAIQDLLRSQA